MTAAIAARDVSYSYRHRRVLRRAARSPVPRSPDQPTTVVTRSPDRPTFAALQQISLEIFVGEIFAFLGPNGGGKTTLFRLLSTLLPLQQGKLEILGNDVQRQQQQVRERIGVVFQAPSLDKKLTVAENIGHQAALYGLSRRESVDRQQMLLAQLGLSDRAGERTETLSGGLRRRVELAKGMIHMPRLLLLDEPSTGLDPGARIDLWTYLGQLREQFGVTVVMTTHLLEEADKADRLAILNQGQLVALGAPDELRATVGGDSVTIDADQPHELAQNIHTQFGVEAGVVDGQVRLELQNGHRWITKIVDAFSDQVKSVRLGKPTLEDVFIDKTGHRFWHVASPGSGEKSKEQPEDAND